MFGAFAALFSAAVPAVVVFSIFAEPVRAQRVFGLDTSSAANGSSPSQTAWNNAFNDTDGDGIAYKFGFVRSSRGGLTVANGLLDDSQFYDNISRGTTAGLLMGSYHYTRADLWDPVAMTGNSGAEDATHFLNRAGMYMKPGYMLPVFDLEAGNTQNNTGAAYGLGHGIHEHDSQCQRNLSNRLYKQLLQ